MEIEEMKLTDIKEKQKEYKEAINHYTKAIQIETADFQTLNCLYNRGFIQRLTAIQDFIQR